MKEVWQSAATWVAQLAPEQQFLGSAAVIGLLVAACVISAVWTALKR